MILSKVSTGHFQGTKGKTAKIVLTPRDPTALAKILKVIYGESEIALTGQTSFDLRLVAGERALVVVYACSSTVYVDLEETDATGTLQLRADKYDPKQPYLSIWVRGN